MTSPFQVDFRSVSATLKGENLCPKSSKSHQDLCLRIYRTCDNSTWFLELVSRPLCACLDSSVECGSRICAVSKYLLAPAARDNFQIFSRGEIIDVVSEKHGFPSLSCEPSCSLMEWNDASALHLILVCVECEGVFLAQTSTPTYPPLLADHVNLVENTIVAGRRQRSDPDRSFPGCANSASIDKSQALDTVQPWVPLAPQCSFGESQERSMDGAAYRSRFACQKTDRCLFGKHEGSHGFLLLVRHSIKTSRFGVGETDPGPMDSRLEPSKDMDRSFLEKAPARSMTETLEKRQRSIDLV